MGWDRALDRDDLKITMSRLRAQLAPESKSISWTVSGDKEFPKSSERSCGLLQFETSLKFQKNSTSFYTKEPSGI